MKLRLILPSVIFLFCGLISRAQVTEVLYQGFEVGETPAYTASPSGNAVYSTTYHMSGDRSLILQQSNTDTVIMFVNELDFSNIVLPRYYISLQFDHICMVPTNTGGDVHMCRIYYKLANDPVWHQLTGSHYNKSSGSYSVSFNRLGSFSINSYDPLWPGNPLSNDLWKSERFDINDAITQTIPADQRKLLIKFEMKKKTGTGAATGKWLIDNLKVKVSPSEMTTPKIQMVHYPEMLMHPSSRGARIELDASTTVGAGIDADSVYLFYRVGSDPTHHRLQMTPVTGYTNRYRAHIPFFGYDTMMSFYCVVRDATTNHNQATFPAADNAWINYKCVRGVEQPGLVTPQFTGSQTSNYFPFYSKASGRSEWVFDSALLAQAGYGPGSMTAMRFTFSSHTNTVSRSRFQIKMKNVATNYSPDLSNMDNIPFTTSFMHVVYDSALVINEANAGMTQTINFQDTFFYAGKDILMQFTYYNPTDYTASPIKMISAPTGKYSVYSTEGDAAYGGNPFPPQNSMDYGGYSDSKRPALIMTQRANLPLLYDMGFDTDPTSPDYGLVTPNYDVAMTPNDHSVQVRLKNCGALPVNAIQISYSIDGNAPLHYNWSANTTPLAGGAISLVTINPNVPLTAGFHTIKVWVEDSLTANGQLYRDHEPYNDTIFSEFVVCEGPMHGIRNIGGTNAHFNTMDEFLYSLSRCGIDDTLIVRLAPGNYGRFEMPAVNGLTPAHYIVFESQSGMASFVGNQPMASIVNLENVDNIRFRNIRFVRSAGALTNMVVLGMTSHNCHFEGCEFIDSLGLTLSNLAASMRINSMINTGFSNGLVVAGCTFVGGNIGVDLKGQGSDAPSQNNTVRGSVFRNQYESAINVLHQTGLNIHRNEMYDVMSGSNYVLLINGAYGASRITANKIYTSHGAGGIGLSNAVGTQALPILVANNMLVNADDGHANQMRTLMNIIQANWTDVVYNSLKMTAPSRNSMATATFGGGVLQNSRFMNNVVVCLDSTNYALNYASGYTNDNTIGHNVYYTLGPVMNKRSNVGYNNLASWSTIVPGDTLSISTNPNFLNGSLVDLRTYNRLIKGVGLPMATVPTDMFDTLRNTHAPCPGAFEFVSLAYDFEPEALVSPEMVTCYMPAQVELKVLLRNSGTSVYSGTGMSISYRLNGGAVHTIPVTTPVPAEDTITIATGQMLNMPANGYRDSVHTLRVWTNYQHDPNATNDTNTFSVTSKYHPATPANVNVSINYAETATITPTVGVDSWKVYGSTAAPRRQSVLYWYHDTTDATPFFVGSSLTTDTLRTDTVFYFRQKREKAIVRFTQVEMIHTTSAQGLTPSMPYWMNNNRKVALQLTNIGDTPACLYGDTILTVSPTAAINNKIFVFTDSVYIQPGEALVLQYATGASANPSATIHTGFTINTAYNSKIAFLYRSKGVVEDAVVFDTTSRTASWRAQNVPSYVWMGDGVSGMTNTCAGIIRRSFNGNSNDWVKASNSNKMFINTINPSWVMYEDNGCDGFFATATVTLLAPPVADIELAVPQIPPSSCGLGMEDVSVKVSNWGVQPVSGLVLNYWAGGDTVTEAVPATIPANGNITYTFNGKLNLSFPHDSLVTVKVWANYITGDPSTLNDTSSASVLALFTPAAPPSLATRLVPYATRDTIDTIAVPYVSGLVPVWYNYEGAAIDTGYNSVSEILYYGGDRGYSYMVTDSYRGIVGTGTSTNGNTAYPAPYQPSNKFAKQQFIYSASELRATGLKPGYIDTISFALQQILGNLNSVSFDEYSIALGTTEDTIFSGTSAWKSVSRVYSRTPMTITQADCGSWVAHPLNTPYYWDGESSLVVQVLHRINSAVSSGVKSAYTTKSNTTLVKYGNTEPAPSLEGYVGVATGRGANRPNARFTSTMYGCVSPMTTYTVQMINIPAVDMAVSWPNGVDTLEYNSCDSIPFYVNLRNQGSASASNTKLYYHFDNQPVDSTMVTGTIVSGALVNVMAVKRHLMPGRHSLTVVVSCDGDLVTSNDTISRSFMVRFCGGSYTIATTGGDYHSFGEAIDTLNVVGVEGAVTFNVNPGTYAEQVILNNIPGSSSTNTISFVGTGDNVLLTAATSQNANYVFYLDSASNVSLRKFRIVARPTGNITYGNALVMRSGDNIHIDSCTIRVKGTINDAKAVCVTLNADVTNLYFSNNVVDSGFVSLKSVGAGPLQNITLSGNTFKNFLSQGIYLRNVNNLEILSNQITTGVTINGRGLTGLYLAQTSGTFNIKKNKVYLIDNQTGGKRGMQFENINCTLGNPGLVCNNMISCSGTGTQGLVPAKPSGIWIDSSSANVNILFNTVRIFHGNPGSSSYSDASYAFFSGNTVSAIKVMNNIFSNFSKGYAYYVSELNTVTLSNNNAYYTTSSRPFAWKNTAIGSLASLQNTNHGDANSLFAEPFFAADNDLHLVMTNFVSKADFSPDVPDDIDGHIRMELPAPTIGAHEMEIVNHDMAVVRITSPKPPTSYNFNPPTVMPPNVETDSVRVVATFYNNGSSTETNVQWYAYIHGHMGTTRSANRNLGTFAPAQSKTDSLWMPTVNGIIDTHTVHVVVVLPTDSSLSDNDRTTGIYLAPAYNFAVTKVQPTATGCDLGNTTVRLTVKNAGYKDIPANMPLTIGYRADITQPAGTTISTMPGIVEEDITVPSTIFMNTSTNIDFPAPANFYPTGTFTNLTIRLQGWVHSDLDYISSNDTTHKNNTAESTVFPSYYTPAAPVGYDTLFAYGTWGKVRASQVNNLPIRWYRDTTASPFYAPSLYPASCWWNNTPQYYHDSTYYLNCISTQGCTSAFSPVHVSVEPLHANDIAFENVLAPLGNRVYMENDTLRIRIGNYGSSAQNNVPLSFILKRGTEVIQTATEMCTANIPAGQSHVYTFNTLLNLTTPTQLQNYSLIVWSDLPSDEVRRNDTIRVAHGFQTLPEATYVTSKPSSPSFDVTRVSFNEIDFEMPALGRGLTNMAIYEEQAREYPVLHVTRGTSDSLTVEITPLDANERGTRYRLWTYVDFDRSGTFTADEVLVNNYAFYGDEVVSRPITISNNASYGYMRMRVVVGLYSDYDASATPPFDGIPSGKSGHNLDFMLFVDKTPDPVDLAVTQIVSPRNSLIRDDQPRTISFRIANKGTAPVENPEFEYRFENENVETVNGTVTYNGTLQPGTSAVLALPAHTFAQGITNLYITHNLDGDVSRDNNTLQKEYCRSYEVTLVFNDDFEGADLWYAPTGNNVYTYNYWRRGTPTKSRINAAYSGVNAWVTDLSSTVVTGKRGSISYLYSPIINISQIRPDTLAFRLRRHLLNNSALRIEFFNFENRWQNLNADSLTNWYNNTDAKCFDESTGGNDYDYYWIPTNVISGDFQEKLQFRFVYTTPLTNSATSGFGEGCAVDDFHVGRARRAIDAGVVRITQPTAPSFGQTINPEVVVHNYGTDTLRSVKIGYTNGLNRLPKEETFSCLLPPDGDQSFLFTSPFIITSDYPDTFQITAFTLVGQDIYYDNDTNRRIYPLSPLENDISAHSLPYPLEHAVAGDSLQVTLRIRNFGLSTISTATATYTVNGQDFVQEELNFESILGRPLASMEYFNYTFHQRFRASMGVMRLVATINSPQNDYIYNDTVTKRIEGVNYVTDLAAAAVVVDTSSHNEVRFSLVIENRGARGVNGFDVGFYIDDDTNTLFTETYERPDPLPALSTGYHRFNKIYPTRSVRYSNVTAFVHAHGDNDPSNDTTKNIAIQYLDLEAVKLIVVENAQPDCKLYLQVRNLGNIALLAGAIKAQVTINGNSFIQNFPATPGIEAQQTRTLLFDRRIPKTPNRVYEGSVTISHPSDVNNDNNQTSLVEVRGWMLGAPLVEVTEFTLDQNYPNPASGTTTIPFSLPNDADVHFFVVDALGHVVTTLDRRFAAGQQTLNIDLSPYPAGVYYYGIEVDGQRRMKKLILR